MPLGQVILNVEYCPGDCSQTVTGHPAVSQVALSRTSVIFRIGLRRQFNVGSSREPCRGGRPVPVSGRSLKAGDPCRVRGSCWESGFVTMCGVRWRVDCRGRTTARNPSARGMR